MEARYEAAGIRARHKVAEHLYTEIYGENGHLDPLRQQEKPVKPYKAESPYNVNNVLWLIAAGAVFYYTDFLSVVFYDPSVHRLWLKIGLALISLNVSIGGFLIIYLSYIRMVPSTEWEKHYPAAIPIATAAFILGAVCVTVALWPLWSILTPLFLFILFMGVVVFIAMMPRF